MPKPPKLGHHGIQSWHHRTDGPSMVDGNTRYGPPRWAMQHWNSADYWRVVTTRESGGTSVETPVLKEGPM